MWGAPSAFTALRRARVPARHLRISRSAVIVIYASSPVPPFQAETLRRPQRPGKPARVTAFLETLQQSTLGEPQETTGIFTMHQQALKTHSRLRESNVPDHESLLKNKVIRSCDKTVEDVNNLWKAQENLDQTAEKRKFQHEKRRNTQGACESTPLKVSV